MNTYFTENNEKSMGKLIHIGAGNISELHDYLAQQFTEIILLEPIPKIYKQLENKITKLVQSNNIRLYNAALSAKAGEYTFYITRPHRYSGLYKADNLTSIFQNLKTEQQISVNTWDFTELIKKSSLDEEQNNTLILQTNGAEYQILAQVEAAKLMLFSTVVIQSSKSNYFQQEKTSNDLITLMKNKGFQLNIEASCDVVFNNLVFNQDESTLKMKASNEKISKQNERIAQLESELSNLQLKNDSSITALAEQNQKSTEQQQAQSNRITELEGQLKASNEAKEEQTSKYNRLVENTEIEVIDIEEQLKLNEASQKSGLQKLTNNNQKLTIELEVAIKERDAQIHLHHENKKWAESLKSKVDLLNCSLEDRTISVSLGQKMLAKAHLDLDNLRYLYSNKIETEKELVDLVKELREKLVLASRYYQQLQKEHPELLLNSDADRVS